MRRSVFDAISSDGAAGLAQATRVAEPSLDPFPSEASALWIGMPSRKLAASM